MLPSLFELKDNGTVVMSIIIKKLQDKLRNRSLFISEVGKILKLLLLSQATNAEIDGIFSALKQVKTYRRLKFWKQPTARSNVSVCLQ